MDKNIRKDSKIYVAGHTGLVGSAIVRTLINNGYENLLLVDSFKLDLRDQFEVEAFFNREKPDYVFLAAAKVGGILANSTYKADFIYDNLAIALNVINSSKNHGVKKLLNLSSSCVYPQLAEQPLKEEYLLSGYLEKTNEPYAIAKIAALKLCSSYNYQYGTNFITLMPSNLYGQYDNFNLETSHVIPAILRKMLLAKALHDENFNFIYKDLKTHSLGFGFDKSLYTDKTGIQKILERFGIFKNFVVLWGTGTARREFLHVDDFADACLYFFECCLPSDIGEFINIGTGNDISILELAKLIKKEVGFSGEINFNSNMPDGVSRKLLDINKASNLGWNYRIKLEDGIKLFINYYYKILE